MFHSIDHSKRHFWGRSQSNAYFALNASYQELNQVENESRETQTKKNAPDFRNQQKECRKQRQIAAIK